LDLSDEKAIITVTLYDRVSWGSGNPTRASQYALLSSQTLGHIFDVLPCSSNEHVVSRMNTVPPSEELQPAINADGCVICINGIAFDDGSQVNYAEYIFLPFNVVYQLTSEKANFFCTFRLSQKTPPRSPKLQLQSIKPLCQPFRFVLINLTGCSIMATASILL
jgi:hypothetical protein